MRYLKVAWLHDLAGEPVTLYSEIGDDGYETRKVEVYSDGRMTFADEATSTGSTWLGEAPVPPIEEIASQAEFVPENITREEFEQIWTNSHRQ